ncbi:uncharacterized protein LOC131997811 [Stomoxys calcitrans]|uniref:uncharacterized protein LOC131997811 n=1 Tax=Stomoxys calcitrans TaxID=35570 RepID=UPI0027E2A4D5|nr:uncharacterized protein LOC131997811 [Stomoxys calcitrans]
MVGNWSPPIHGFPRLSCRHHHNIYPQLAIRAAWRFSVLSSDLGKPYVTSDWKISNLEDKRGLKIKAVTLKEPEKASPGKYEVKEASSSNLLKSDRSASTSAAKSIKDCTIDSRNSQLYQKINRLQQSKLQPHRSQPSRRHNDDCKMPDVSCLNRCFPPPVKPFVNLFCLSGVLLHHLSLSASPVKKIKLEIDNEETECGAGKEGEARTRAVRNGKGSNNGPSSPNVRSDTPASDVSVSNLTKKFGSRTVTPSTSLCVPFPTPSPSISLHASDFSDSESTISTSVTENDFPDSVSTISTLVTAREAPPVLQQPQPNMHSDEDLWCNWDSWQPVSQYHRHNWLPYSVTYSRGLPTSITYRRQNINYQWCRPGCTPRTPSYIRHNSSLRFRLTPPRY